MEDVYDFLVIGSGFGGSVSALRLAEKGYRVAVLEAGRRWRCEDFPKTNWNLPRFLWAPALLCYGIQRIGLFKHFLALSGAGVGGGSLVYAATLYDPPEAFYRDSSWSHLDDDWQATLAPHLATARRMLGVVRNARLTRADRLLEEYARSIGREDRYHPTDVGIFFGNPGETVPDPLLGGEGPERTGCDFTAACMIGCPSGSKNTLDKNYLYLAEKLGVEIHPETLVTGIRPDRERGYLVASRRATSILPRTRRTWHARQVVVAAGTLGTLKLLLTCRRKGWLPKLSHVLGARFRTNSEVIVGARSTRSDANFSEGIAISSSLYVTDDTHIEVVSYPEGSDAMGLLASVLTDGDRGWKRPFKFLWACLKHPGQLLRSLYLPGWAKQSVILLAMQTVDNYLEMRLRRGWLPPWRLSLRSYSPQAIPTYIPEANKAARYFAEHMGGFAQGAISEVFLNRPITAHVLGGCTMGSKPEDGVVDKYGQVFGHEGLYVADGSIIPANLGANPSLTITALAEHVMSAVPEKG